MRLYSRLPARNFIAELHKSKKFIVLNILWATQWYKNIYFNDVCTRDGWFL